MLGLLAHALHWSFVLLGVAGAAYLLLPPLRVSAFLPRHRPGDELGYALGYRPPRSLPEHHERVLQLRAAVAAGRLEEVRTSPVRGRTARATYDGWSDLRAVVATSSLSAGVIHAAVFPHHLQERLAVGAFFALTAVAQIVWAVLAIRSASNRLLWAGVAGNLFLVWLWAVSRTTGLPAGLADGHHGVGPWDLAAKAWELAVVAGCLLLLRRPAQERVTALAAVGRRAWLWAALSTLALTLITLLVPHE